MTHQDLKEAAMKATEAHAAYKADNAFQNELAWHDAEARFRLVATRSRILSLIEDNERMREALTPFAEFNTKIDAHPDAAKTPDDYCIHDGLKVGDFRRAFSVIKDKP